MQRNRLDSTSRCRLLAVGHAAARPAAEPGPTARSSSSDSKRRSNRRAASAAATSGQQPIILPPQPFLPTARGWPRVCRPSNWRRCCSASARAANKRFLVDGRVGPQIYLGGRRAERHHVSGVAVDPARERARRLRERRAREHRAGRRDPLVSAARWCRPTTRPSRPTSGSRACVTVNNIEAASLIPILRPHAAARGALGSQRDRRAGSSSWTATRTFSGSPRSCVRSTCAPRELIGSATHPTCSV